MGKREEEGFIEHKYKSYHIANTILRISSVRGMKLNLLKLMKLSYIVTGYCLCAGFDPFKEDIQAWKLGPVIPSLWHEFKQYGVNKNIENYASDIDWESEDLEGYTPFVETSENDKTSKYTIAIISYLVDKYKNHSGWDLVHATHGIDTPWEQTWQKRGSSEKKVIKKSLIKAYYKKDLDIAFF